MSDQLALQHDRTNPDKSLEGDGSKADTGTAATATGDNTGQLRVFVFALFFIFGGITSLNDVIIPKLRELFTLSYAEVMTVQSAFFGAYFVISLPAAAVVRRIGYMRSAVVGLLLMMIGCLLFKPASSSAQFQMFLIALFIVAAGITVVQVVANPLISLLGPPATVYSRLTFAQAFNSLGTTVFPYVGSALILGSLATVDPKTLRGAALMSYRARATHVIGGTYLGLALALLVLATMVWWYRNHLREHRIPGSSWREALGLLRVPRFIFGASCIFLYVGAEVAIGSLTVNYLMQADVRPIALAALISITAGCISHRERQHVYALDAALDTTRNAVADLRGPELQLQRVLVPDYLDTTDILLPRTSRYVRSFPWATKCFQPTIQQPISPANASCEALT